MPQDYTVTQVKARGPKDNPHGGQLYRFYCSFRDEAGEVVDDCYWQRKSADLEVGEVVYGHIEDGEYGKRFKTDQRPDGAGNFKAPDLTQARPGHSGVPSDPQAERSRRIERQHSQEMAIRTFALTDAGRGKVDASSEDMQRFIKSWTNWFVQDLDVELGSGQAAHGASPNSPPVAEDAADLSAVNALSVEEYIEQMVPPNEREEASPAQKGALTKLFHEAGLSREAMQAVVMFRCGQEKATKQGASQLITDLQDGATHDALLAEIYDAHRAGNPLGTRAAALIPTDLPWEDDGSLPETPAKDEENIPF